MDTVNVALLGAGTVGSAFYRLVQAHQSRLRSLDVEVAFAGVMVRDLSKPRLGIPESLLRNNPAGLLEQADVLVEAMGGTDLAGGLVLEALEQGIPVITANKALLAERWSELLPYAEEGLLYYEASVMAGVPVIAALSGALWGNRVQEVHAVLNGTTNYILGRLEEGATYAQALAEAQAKGYAEADPTLDVGGFDAAHKLTVLARLTADPQMPWETVKANTTGITHLSPELLKAALAEGQRVFLVGSLYGQNGQWQAKVRPVKLPLSHPIAQVGRGKGVMVFRGDAVGELVFSGAGAGGEATASGMLGDFYQMLMGFPGHTPIPDASPAPQAPLEALPEV